MEPKYSLYVNNDDVYTPDIWYDTEYLSLPTKRRLLIQAKNFSAGKWWVDIKPGIQRKRIDMKWNKILNLLDDKSDFHVVYRRGYMTWKELNTIFSHQRWALEVGFVTYDSPEYYLWIYVSDRYAELLIDKFKLTERKI